MPFELVSIAAIIILLAAIIFYIKYFRSGRRAKRSAEYIGAKGEEAVGRILDRTRQPHYLINDIILVDDHQNTSQVDHIFINRYGVWVIETKNYAGMIFGSENQREWTQVLAYGKEKHRFYNPVKQNVTHVYNVRRLIGIDIPVYSVVVFLRADISNVDCGGVCSANCLEDTVCTDRGEHLSIEKMKKCFDTLIEYKMKPNVTLDEHIENIHDRQREYNNNICPRCHKKLILKKGPNGQFWGCSNYPKCKFSKPVL